MTIKEDFLSYEDGNGFMCPQPCPPGVMRGSDNGPMFTSEYYIILQRNNQLTLSDATYYSHLIQSCVNSNNLLTRAPGDTTTGNPDDHLAVYNAHQQFKITPSFRLPFALYRMPQVIAAAISAHFTSFYNPLHWLVRLLAFPLYLITAVIILFSNMNEDPTNSNDRRLAWHLIENVKKVSLLCYLASLIWYNRLNSTYSGGMQGVARLYYSPTNNNPYADFWVQKS